MQPFIFHTPTKIVFGEDTAGGVGDMLAEMNASKPWRITDANLRKAGILNSILEGLKDAYISEPVIFDQVPSDSDIVAVCAAVKDAQAGGCDSVIAVGGGSVLDTAKVANIGLSLGTDVLDFEGMNTLSARLFPLIAIPTTAGTGSEVSAVAMIKDHEQHKKLIFGSRFLFPDAAVLDPKLILSLPPRLTAATGLDALSHALESTASATSNSPSDTLALEAAKLIFTHLPHATKDGANIDARGGMLAGSMIAGLAFTNAGVGIVHALSHSFGAKFGTHHGLTNAVFLPLGMEFNEPAAGHIYESVDAYLSIALRTAPEPARSWFSGERGSSNLVSAVRKLIAECGLPSRLRDIGVPELSDADLEELGEAAVTDASLMFNLQPASPEELIDIIKRAY